MSLVAVAVVAVAYGLDRLFGEPPTAVHPVVWFGRLVEPLDRSWNHPHAVGVIIAVGLPIVAAAAVWAVVGVAWRVHPSLGVAAGAGGLFVATSHRRLVDETRGVIDASGTDVVAARERVPALVGRDPSRLSPDELRSAAVESAAENLTDGLVAPMLAFAALVPVSVTAGVAAAAWVKGVNTLDSMLGYPVNRHGTASARLDDAVMWVPARLTAGLLALVGRRPGALARARSDATAPPSPNAGWPMGTLAGLLDVGLVKPGEYVLNAEASLPTERRANQGADLVDRTGHLVFGLVAGWSAFLWGVGL